MQNIRFHFQARVALNNRKRLKTFIAELFSKEARELESLDIIFCDDDYLLDINRRFLRHDYYTDIISFDYSTSKHQPLIGEVYISVDRVRANALQLAVPFQTELLRVTFHGPLHFCGYSDKSTKKKTVMREREDFYIAQFKMFHVEPS